jgi:hypothetical protein
LAKARIDAADCRLEPGLYFGLIAQAGVDLPCTSGQNFAGGQSLSSRFARVGHFKEPDQKLGDLAGGHRLLIRAVPLLRNAARLDGHADCEHDEQGEERRRAGDGHPVTPNKLRDSVRSSGRSC